jgi:hypothetical protein
VIEKRSAPGREAGGRSNSQEVGRKEVRSAVRWEGGSEVRRGDGRLSLGSGAEAGAKWLRMRCRCTLLDGLLCPEPAPDGHGDDGDDGDNDGEGRKCAL